MTMGVLKVARKLVLHISLLMLAGCEHQINKELAHESHQVQAPFSATPVTVDGKLDEPIWKVSPKYTLSLPGDADGVDVQEPGTIQFAFDRDNFYVAATFNDSDVIAEGTEDQLHHYLLGDLCEIFLKPEDQSWYWELYATPLGKKSSFFYPSRGRLGMPSCEDADFEMMVASHCDGSLNDWTDVDKLWTSEMAIPIKELTARGETFGPGSKWRVSAGRYNFSKYLSQRELSSFPQHSKTDFHRYEEYAILDLQGAPPDADEKPTNQ